MNKQSIENQENIQKLAKEAFAIADSDGSNSISVDELQTLIEQIAESLDIECPPNEEIEKLLIEFDDNGDGVLQLEEFQNLVQQLFTPKQQSDDEDNESSKTQSQRNSVEYNKQEQELVPIKKYQKPGFKDFIHTVQEKKLSVIDSKFHEMLIKQQNRQSRLSCTLDLEVGNLVKEIDFMTQPKSSIADKKFLYKQSRISIQERQSIDKRYMDNSYVVRTGSISSVYTSMEPKSNNNSA